MRKIISGRRVVENAGEEMSLTTGAARYQNAYAAAAIYYAAQGDVEGLRLDLLDLLVESMPKDIYPQSVTIIW